VQTYSHALLGFGLKTWLKGRGAAPSWMLAVGSFAPDIPLVLLTVWFFWDRGEITFGRGYDDYYFRNSLWIAAHNLFHSPPPILLGVYLGRRFGWKKFFWFWVGCGFHSVIDIATHYHDGPLLLWPFDWEWRFLSPISYWDPRHYGRIAAPIEHLLDLSVLVWLGYRRFRRSPVPTPPGT